MLYGWFLRAFGMLPDPLRYRIVRLIKPKYTVGTIPFVFRPDGRLLLVRHSYKTGWATPGGFVNRREVAADAAVREVREEVGLDVVVVGEPAVVIDESNQRVEVVLLAEVTDASAAESASPRSPEIVDVGWFEPGALPPLQPETRWGWDALSRSGQLGERSARTASQPDSK